MRTDRIAADPLADADEFILDLYRRLPEVRVLEAKEIRTFTLKRRREHWCSTQSPTTSPTPSSSCTA